MESLDAGGHDDVARPESAGDDEAFRVVAADLDGPLRNGLRLRLPGPHRRLRALADERGARDPDPGGGIHADRAGHGRAEAKTRRWIDQPDPYPERPGDRIGARRDLADAPLGQDLGVGG